MKTIHKMSRSRKCRADKTCECQLLHSEHMLEVRARGDTSESSNPAGGCVGEKFFFDHDNFFSAGGKLGKKGYFVRTVI